MAFQVADRVKETTTTTGTGTIDLVGAVEGYQTFVAGIGNGNETYYSISNRDADEWEVGIGTVTDAATDTLSRDTIISSSNGGSAVNFSAGTKDVICTLPADRSFVIDDEANVSVTANVTATSFDGSGATLTALNASNLASGTLPDARFPATLPTSSGANLTNLNASNVSSGTLDDARLTANVTLNNASTISAGTLADARLTANVNLNNASTISAGTLADARLTANVNLNNASTISAGTLADARLTANVTLNNASTISTGTLPNARLSSIPNSALDNSAITINGSGVSLGGSINVGDITGVTAGSGLTGGGTTGAVTLNVGAGTLIDVAADTVSVDLSELTTSTSDADGDFFAVVDSANAQKRLTKGSINISGFNNDAGYTTNVGDITGVTAGSGLTGGGSSGTPTLNVGAGTGIDVSADAIAVDVSDFMSNGSNNRVLTATGADAMNAEANMTFDGSTLAVNRAASDGDILDLQKGGTTVGSIGSAASTDLYVSSGDTGFRIVAANDNVRPCNSTGNNRDNAVDL